MVQIWLHNNNFRQEKYDWHVLLDINYVWDIKSELLFWNVKTIETSLTAGHSVVGKIYKDFWKSSVPKIVNISY